MHQRGAIITLTISRDRTPFEEREPILALKRRHLARGKLGHKFRRLVRSKVHIFARLVESESSNGGNRLDLDRSGPHVNICAEKTACGEIDVREDLFLAVQNRRTESQSTFFGVGKGVGGGQDEDAIFDCDRL